VAVCQAIGQRANDELYHSLRVRVGDPEPCSSLAVWFPGRHPAYAAGD
jgi:hypothetical protein